MLNHYKYNYWDILNNFSRYCLLMRNFLTKIKISNYENNCWLWHGCKSENKQTGKHTYGMISLNGKMIPSSRAAYLLFKGDFDPKLEICHKCDNTLCNNPNHLFTGTHQDNMDDMMKKNRRNPPIGERHAMSKLNWKLVNDLRNDYINNLATSQIQKKYNIESSQFLRIVKNESWYDPNYKYKKRGVMRKFSKEIENEIWELSKTQTQTAISKKYNCTNRYISYLLSLLKKERS